MSLFVNDSQIIGSIIPDVYVKSITLESKPSIPSKKDDPHISHPLDDKSPAVSSSKPMKVTLRLLLKENLDASQFESWFYNQDFKKYLNLSVVQSTSPEWTELLSLTDYPGFVFENSTWTIIATLMEIFNKMPSFVQQLGLGVTPEYAETAAVFAEQKDAYLKVQKINVGQGEIQGTESTLTNGDRIIDFVYDIDFDVPDDNPQHLSYFVMTSLDLETISEDFGITSSGLSHLNKLNGKTTLEKVFEASKLVSKAYIYYDEQGLVWTGEAYKSNDDGGWYAGKINDVTTDPAPLTRKTVSNNKIRDFRVYDRIQKGKVDFSFIENDFFNSKLPYKMNDTKQLAPAYSQNYFTDCYLSKNKDDTRSFWFGVDMNKLATDRAQFASVFSSDKTALASSLRVSNISILRRRVKKGVPTLNNLGNPVLRNQIFDNNFPDAIVAQASQNASGIFVNHSGVSEGFVADQGQPWLGSGIGLEFQQGTTWFMGHDSAIASITDGHYQYGVEIEIEDNTASLLIDSINELGKARKSLHQYYILASKVYNPRTGKGNFHPDLNRFTDSFIDKFQEMTTFPESEEDQISIGVPIFTNLLDISDIVTPEFQAFQAVYTATTTYIATLELFGMFSTEGELDVFTEQIHGLLEPSTGTPESIDMVIKLIDNMLSRLQRLAGVHPKLVKDSSSVLSSTKPIPKRFKIKHFFPTIIDSNEPKDVGYDFLSPKQISEPKGFFTIPASEYEARVNLETLKYFQSLALDTNDQLNIEATKLAYLTPIGVNLANLGNVDLSEEPFDAEKTALIQSALTKLNLGKKSPFIPLTIYKPKNLSSPDLKPTIPLQIETNVTDTLAAFNLDILPLEVANDTIDILNGTVDPYADAGNIMGEEYEQVDQPTEKPDSLNMVHPQLEGGPDATLYLMELLFPLSMSPATSTNFFFDNTQLKPLSLTQKRLMLDTFNITKFYSLEGTSKSPGRMKKKFNMQTMPNQIKSLFFKADPGVKYNWEEDTTLPPITRSAMILNYKSIMKVEYLSGYQKDSLGRPMLKSPIWKQLDNQAMNGRFDKRLCRLVRYEDKELGIFEPVGMRMPVYNEYFFIKGEGEPTPQRQRQVGSRTQTILKKRIEQHRNLRPEYLSTGTMSTERIRFSSEDVKKVAAAPHPRKLKF